MTAEVFNFGEVRRKARKPRPKKYVWLDTVKADSRLGSCPHLSRRLIADYAELLSSFSSFERDGVYAGRPNLSRRLGVSIRQITRLNRALSDMGFAQVKRRGQETNLVVPILDGKRLFPTGPEVTSEVTPDVTRRSHQIGVSMGPTGHPSLLEQDRKLHNLNSLQPFEARLSADPPPSNVGDGVSPTFETGASGTTSRSLSTKGAETVLDGEIIEPATFSEFWNRSRRHSDSRDKPGPARKAFEMLSDEERQEITERLDRDGEIDLGGEWTCLWLKARAWHEAPLRKSGVAGALDALRRPRSGSREDRQEQTTLARRRFRGFAQSQDVHDDSDLAGMGHIAARRDAQREPEQYPVIEGTRAFDEWCQHYRFSRRVPPLTMDLVGPSGQRFRGFYMPTPYPPKEDRGSE
jgi:hypothetical protein